MKEWSYEEEWFEETNVARKIKKYLQEMGYQIEKFNENKRKKGPDIIAKKGNIKLIIEVKGYPSDKYVNSKKKGQKNQQNQIHRLGTGLQKHFYKYY